MPDDDALMSAPLYYGVESGPAGTPGMAINPYADQITAAQAAEQDLAAQAYGEAGAAGGILGAQMRGQAMMPAMGEALGGGDALASRRAMTGAAQAGYGGSVQGVQRSSSDRLAAADQYMSAAQKRAQYEQAAYQRWLDHWEGQRRAEDVERGAEAAARQADAMSRATARQAAGAALGAASAGISAAQDGSE